MEDITEMAWREGKAIGLTDQEIRIANRLARNLSNMDIARHLSVTPRTVAHHTARIYNKLGMPPVSRGRQDTRRFEAIQRLRKMGLGNER